MHGKSVLIRFCKKPEKMDTEECNHICAKCQYSNLIKSERKRVLKVLDRENKMRLNNDPKKLKMGDLIITDYHTGEKSVVRKITKITKDLTTGSGYRASADAGKVCRLCKRPFAGKVLDVDAAWLIPYKKEGGSAKNSPNTHKK